MNPHRGQTNISLAGKSYPVKLTLDGIAKIESSVGCSIIKIAQKLSQGDLTVSEISTILTYAIRSGGNNLTSSDVNIAIWEEGIVNCMKLTGDLITIALDTGEKGKE